MYPDLISHQTGPCKGGPFDGDVIAGALGKETMRQSSWRGAAGAYRWAPWEPTRDGTSTGCFLWVPDLQASLQDLANILGTGKRDLLLHVAAHRVDLENDESIVGGENMPGNDLLRVAAAWSLSWSVPPDEVMRATNRIEEAAISESVIESAEHMLLVVAETPVLRTVDANWVSILLRADELPRFLRINAAARCEVVDMARIYNSIAAKRADALSA